MDTDRALDYVSTARRIGSDRGLKVTVAILDAAGHPVAVVRGGMEKWHGPYMASGKARLAAAFQRPTSTLLESWKDRPLFPLSLTEVLPGGVTLNPGGCPIFEDGRCVGAIGVGGGTPEDDDAVARETVARMGDSIEGPPRRASVSESSAGDPKRATS